MDINKDELELLINSALSGLGEGCNDCHKAFSETIPNILTRHESVLVENKKGDFEIVAAKKFFVGPTFDACIKAYKEVFGTTADTEQLTKAFNHLDIMYYNLFSSPRNDDIANDILVKNFANFRDNISNI